MGEAMKKRFRVEKDSLGDVKVPADALYGVQTQRAVHNFPVSGVREHPDFIKAYALIKKAAVEAAHSLKAMERWRAQAIVKAASEIISGKHQKEFVLDVFQAGAGTSFNMNTNEVIANRALELLKKSKGDYKTLSPNDHVNYGQSTNDSFPTAIRLGGLFQRKKLLPVLDNLAKAFEAKGREFQGVLKSGRTHLQDAVPITLGQEFRAYGAALRRARRRLKDASDELLELPIGGNAVGTGVNTPKGFREKVVRNLARYTRLKLRPSDDPMEMIQSQQPVAATSGALRDLALELSRIASDLRLLSSGPTTGIDEIRLPPVQPGSSIMPGKVNPVMAECLNMVAFQVIGYDTTIAYAVQGGQLDLNVMMPIMAYDLMMAFEILINYLPVFQEKCIEGIKAQPDRCRGYLEKNPALATLLNPFIGYLQAGEIAKQSVRENRSVLDIVREKKILTEAQIKKVFSVKNLTGHLERDSKKR